MSETSPDLPLVLLTNPIHPEGEALLAAHARIVTAPDAQPETLRRLAADAAGIIVRAPLPDDILDHAPRLRGIVRHGVGLDFIPVASATAHGVPVANLPGSNTQAVAEYVFSALFHLRRPLGTFDRTLRSQGWGPARKLSDTAAELRSSTIGILGVGSIGTRIAEIARHGFAMTVLGTSRRRGRAPGLVEDVELTELFRRSDAVVLSCALTEETRGLVNAGLIGVMKPEAVLINVSRGPVVETGALLAALNEGRLAGAALDVHDIQPLPADSPGFESPNLLLTPHLAALTATSGRAMSLGAVEEMIRILSGEPPLNLVNPEALKAKP